jgi:hypothetical protein
MAQRFAIDGNFTQSFAGTVNLNASACPANIDEYASLYYDLNTGTVCYVTSSTDFCYEYIYGANDNNVPKSTPDEPIPRIKTYPRAQRFTFAAYDTDGGGYDFSVPTQDVTEAVFVAFDSESVNAGDLSNYLLQNASTGSIKLSTNTQAVEFDYTAQHVMTGSGPSITDEKKIILGNSNVSATASNPQFTLITKTSDEPFTNGETVCVEVIRQGGGGGTATTYQTGSDTTQTDLNNLKIVDYDSNVFVTSDPITGQLTLQFGQRPEPNNLSISPVNFNEDRFNLEQQGYTVRFSYNLNGTTYNSASLFTYNGVPIMTNTIDPNSPTDFVINGSGNTLPYMSGSHRFKVSMNVELSDGSVENFLVNSSLSDFQLDKVDPGFPKVNTTSTSDPNLGDIDFVEVGNSLGTLKLHVGFSGSFQFTTSSGALNGWAPDPNNPNSQNPAGGTAVVNSRTGEATNFVSLTNNFISPQDPDANSPDLTLNHSRTYSQQRIFTFRTGSTSDATISEYDALSRSYLTTEGFGFPKVSDTVNENPTGILFSINGASGEYHWFIFSDEHITTSSPVIKDQNDLTVNSVSQVAHYQNIVGTTGYRLFRTNTQLGAGALTYKFTNS